MYRMIYLGLAVLFATPNLWSHEPDLKKLPLGDGKISTSPKKNWIWACRVDPNAGGAFKVGPWIKSDGTYDFTAKPKVPGQITWPRKFVMSETASVRKFSANDFPDHPTGIFPIPETSEAFKFDRNPNSIKAQNMEFELPLTPELASEPQCAPGTVGILLSGAVLFNALDAPGRDAVAHETQDSCEGHPQESGVYHYHSLSSCIKDEQESDGHSKIVGYALDGFGIFGRHGVGGQTLSSSDLDECHGHTHEVNWNGKRISIYHYHATWDFPYTVGCLRGRYDRFIERILSGPPPDRGGFGEPNPSPYGTRGETTLGGPPGGRRPPGGKRGPPDLSVAAKKLGVSESQLQEALGPPPPDIEGAAEKLGITPEQLKDALGPPPN